MNDELKQMLSQFTVVFEEPKGIPPSRSKDHRIILKEGASHLKIIPHLFFWSGSQIAVDRCVLIIGL